MPGVHSKCSGCDKHGNRCTGNPEIKTGLCFVCKKEAREAAACEFTETLLVHLPSYYRDTFVGSDAHYCALTFFLTGRLFELTPGKTQGTLVCPQAARAARAGHIMPANQGHTLAKAPMMRNNLMTNSAIAEDFIGSRSVVDVLNCPTSLHDFLQHLNHRGYSLERSISLNGYFPFEVRMKMFAAWVEQCPMDTSEGCVDGVTGCVILPPVAQNASAPPSGAGAFAQAPTGSGGIGSRAQSHAQALEQALKAKYGPDVWALLEDPHDL